MGSGLDDYPRSDYIYNSKYHLDLHVFNKNINSRFGSTFLFKKLFLLLKYMTLNKYL